MQGEREREKMNESHAEGEYEKKHVFRMQPGEWSKNGPSVLCCR
jgi:hypothetical protein